MFGGRDVFKKIWKGRILRPQEGKGKMRRSAAKSRWKGTK